MTVVINIIPSDYHGNPRNALGYPWQDLVNKIPGHDVILDKTGKFYSKTEGADYIGAAREAMLELGVTAARVTCMWCGGWSGTVSADHTSKKRQSEQAGEEPPETANIIKTDETITLNDQDDINKHHTGYCTKCHSYCYGDCTASY